MPSPFLAEAVSDAITAHITDNIKAALEAVSTARGDDLVGLEEPRTIVTFPMAKLYETPAIIIITENLLFKNDAGPNFVKGKSRTIVSTVVEERSQELLNRKLWRYQAALFDLLAQTQLASSDQKVKLIIVPVEMVYSDFWTNTDPSNAEAVFRREATFELEVNHLENF